MKVLSFNIQPVLPAKLVLCALLMGVLVACSDDSAGQFTFNDNPFLTSGVYRAADNTLAIDIQPGATVANVKGGALTCFRQ